MVAAMTLRAGLILVGLSAALLSGCGGQDSTPIAWSPSMRPAKTGPATPTEPTHAPKSEPPETSEPDAATDLVGFTSPSGNVGCIVDSAYVRCDISERDWTPPPRPADCEFDYGQGISLSGGETAAFVCAGDTASRRRQAAGLWPVGVGRVDSVRQHGVRQHVPRHQDGAWLHGRPRGVSGVLISAMVPG